MDTAPTNSPRGAGTPAPEQPEAAITVIQGPDYDGSMEFTVTGIPEPFSLSYAPHFRRWNLDVITESADSDLGDGPIYTTILHLLYTTDFSSRRGTARY